MGFLLMGALFIVLPRTMVSAKRINQVLDLHSSIKTLFKCSWLMKTSKVRSSLRMWPSAMRQIRRQLLNMLALKQKLVKQWPLLGQQVLVNQLWSIWFHVSTTCQQEKFWWTVSMFKTMTSLRQLMLVKRLPLLGRLGLVRQPLSIFDEILWDW